MNLITANIKRAEKLIDNLGKRTFSSNFLAAFFIAAFIIIVADLTTETASEKDEAGFFMGIFEESSPTIDLSSNLLLKIERPLLFNIGFEYSFPKDIIDKNSAQDRGPPGII